MKSLGSIVMMIAISLLVGCSGSKKLVPYKTVRAEHYTISKFANKSLFQHENNKRLYSINYTVANIFHKNDPYVNMRNQYKDIFQTLCNNHGGKLVRGKNLFLTNHIKEVFMSKKRKYKNKSYTVTDTFATILKEQMTHDCIRSYGRNCNDIKKTYVIRGTTVPAILPQKICKKIIKKSLHTLLVIHILM